jgi:hypothetical protein
MWNTIRSIGIRSLSSGKFWQFCGLLVLLYFIHSLESGDKVEIVKLVVSAPLFHVLGWALALLLAVGCVIVHAVIRKEYLREIERLSKERDALQEKLLTQPVQHSGYKPK